LIFSFFSGSQSKITFLAYAYTASISRRIFSCERIVCDSSLILGFTTGRILLVSEVQLSGFWGLSRRVNPEPALFRALGEWTIKNPRRGRGFRKG
jgi:hypothetical protein